VSDSLVQRLEPRHYEDVAHRLLPEPIYQWIRSGADDEQSLRDNSEAFRRWRVLPHVLVDVTSVKLETTVLGTPIAFPVMVGPMGIQKAAHGDGELGMAEGAARAGTLMVEAINATVSMADLASAQPKLPTWIQLYNWNDRDALAGAIAKAEEAGVKAIVPLVNTPIGVSHTPWQVGYRLPAGVSFANFTTSPDLEAGNTWEYLEWIASRTSLPVVPKGIVRGDDARRAVDAGAKGILVSNHGGRQLRRSLATIDALPGVVEAVRGQAEVFLDGGVRTGADVLTALALGARAVTIGRPAMWGLVVGGADGVERVLATLKAELADDAGLCGVADVGDIPAGLVVRAPA
jgi:isopentenyl diphosphate isomerase/L-lactate dehydrogenase-like FMN-dependent dehydrogenase